MPPAVRRRYVRCFDRPGILTFTPSADHATVTDYTIRIYAIGTTSPVVSSRNIGKPTPDGSNNTISHDIAALIAPLAAGTYTVTVLTTSPGGSAETTGVNFAAPLA